MTDEIYAKVFDQAGTALVAARKAMAIASGAAILSVVALVIALWR